MTPVHADTADDVDLHRPRPGGPVTGRIPLVVALTVGAGAACALLMSGWVGQLGDSAYPGLVRAGRVTELALPVARSTTLVCATGTIGVLALRLLVLPAGASVPGAARVCAYWARAWGLVTVAWTALTVSDVSGVPVWAVPQRISELTSLLSADLVRAQLSSVVLVCAVALVARSTRTRVVRAALLLSCTALVLPLLTSHVGHAQRIPAVGALAVHAVAAAVWAGCLLAVVVHLRGRQGLLPRSVERLSTVSLTCAVLVVLSGFTTAVAGQVTTDDLGSPYGRLLVVKAGIFCVLVGFGMWHRRTTVPAAVAGSTRALRRLATGELALLGATFGVASTLAATTPPWT